MIIFIQFYIAIVCSRCNRTEQTADATQKQYLSNPSNIGITRLYRTKSVDRELSFGYAMPTARADLYPTHGTLATSKARYARCGPDVS